MDFSDRLKQLLAERGDNWINVSKATGIGKNQQRRWEDSKSLPDGKSLVKLSEYFGVTTDYLLGIDTLKDKVMVILDNPSLTLTSEEKWFILKLRQLDREGRAVVEGTLISEVRRIESKRDTDAFVG